jgi:hypothetical protein
VKILNDIFIFMWMCNIPELFDAFYRTNTNLFNKRPPNYCRMVYLLSEFPKKYTYLYEGVYVSTYEIDPYHLQDTELLIYFHDKKRFVFSDAAMKEMTPQQRYNVIVLYPKLYGTKYRNNTYFSPVDFRENWDKKYVYT